MPPLESQGVRTVLLEIIQENIPADVRMQNMQQVSILREAEERLGCRGNLEIQREILFEWRELFRTGYLTWGHDLNNPDPPFFHITGRGEQALENLSRDPSNPQGYLSHLSYQASVCDVSMSYITEGLECYIAGLHKSAAVMVGAASEGILLDLREKAMNYLQQQQQDIPRGLDDWKVRTITNALKHYFDSVKRSMESSFRDEYEAYWPAFSQQIRAARNDAGHPSSIEPVTADTVHASFLILPELASLSNKLERLITFEGE